MSAVQEEFILHQGSCHCLASPGVKSKREPPGFCILEHAPDIFMARHTTLQYEITSLGRLSGCKPFSSIYLLSAFLIILPCVCPSVLDRHSRFSFSGRSSITVVRTDLEELFEPAMQNPPFQFASYSSAALCRPIMMTATPDDPILPERQSSIDASGVIR